MADHDGITKGHKCGACGTILKEPMALKRHISYVHEFERCYSCGKTFSDAKALLTHKKSVHGRKKEVDDRIAFSCAYCNKPFQNIADLRTHLKNLHQEFRKVYKCEICGIDFERKGMLTDHKKTTEHKMNLYNAVKANKM